MEYSKEREEFDISMRIFKDDLQTAINHAYDTNINLVDITGQTDQIKHINRYINDAFYVKSNGITCPIKPMHHEITDEAILLSYSCQVPDDLTSIEIRNTILMDIYHDQTNLVIFSYTGREKGLRFTINDYVKKIDVTK